VTEIAGLGYPFDSVAAALTAHRQVSSYTFRGELLLALWLVIRGRRTTSNEPGQNGKMSNVPEAEAVLSPATHEPAARWMQIPSPPHDVITASVWGETHRGCDRDAADLRLAPAMDPGTRLRPTDTGHVDPHVSHDHLARSRTGDCEA